MKLRVSLLVALSHLLCSAAEAAHPKVLMSEDSTTGFIVVLNEPDADISSIQAKADALTAGNPSITVTAIIDKALTAFVADMTTEEAEAMADSDAVKYIEQNGMVYPSQDATWGLDRIDQRDLPLNDVYNAPGNGEGVTAYVIDTGINKSHEEFDNGRASYGINLFGGDDADCNGHGTHVAGTIAGRVYGVANKAKVIAIKVFGCSGGTSYSMIIQGINWAMTHAEDNDTIATSNLSIGGSRSTVMNDAVNNMQDAGIVTVVAAGNSNADACNFSPASAEKVISVASSTSTDSRSSFSNKGTCTHIFAPGSSITSAWYISNNAYNTISGTSMASPHVCGAAAILLGSGADPADVKGILINTATPDKISDPGNDSPNKLLYVTADSGPTMPPTQAPPSMPPTQAPTTMSPTQAPTMGPDCVDSPAIFELDTLKKRCKYVARKTKLCKEYKISIHCPKTCGRCEYSANDSVLPFYQNSGGSKYTCQEIFKLKDGKKTKMCKEDKFYNTCRATCMNYMELGNVIKNEK